jgi:hypothetical protein
MKPLYRQLKSNHYSSDYSSPSYLAVAISLSSSRKTLC